MDLFDIHQIWPHSTAKHYASPTGSQLYWSWKWVKYKYEASITSCLIILNLTPTASVCFDVEACFFIMTLFCVKANGKGSIMLAGIRKRVSLCLSRSAPFEWLQWEVQIKVQSRCELHSSKRIDMRLSAFQVDYSNFNKEAVRRPLNFSDLCVNSLNSCTVSLMKNNTETLVNIHQTTQYHFLRSSNLRNRCPENLKSHNGMLLK